jgi:H3 lysine-79-specific histone-lysine N-methyltransferase
MLICWLWQLVNNEVFPPSLNADLTNMFLDLKDGAKIVSLKPFVSPDFRMNESNVCHLSLNRSSNDLTETKQCDSFAAIVKLSQHTYLKNMVTWKGDSGVYYIQTIDRSMRIKYEEVLSGSRRRR